MTIAVVIPTIREKNYYEFLEHWKKLFKKHSVKLITVKDGDNPTVNEKTVSDVMGEHSDTIYNFNSGIRNLGFAYVAKYLPEVKTIITLDDDTEPFGDTIQDHLNILDQRVSTSWISTASEYTRGFPYCIRGEAEVVLSHGVWEGIKDWDAPTQLVCGNKDVEFYRGIIPKGIFYPMCIMNVAFKRKMLPFIYQAPMFDDLNRFEDIWAGIESKKEIDKRNWAVVTGYSKVWHNRASNVFSNLKKEARGLEMNENYGDGEYFKLYAKKRARWQKFIKKHL
jgi:hypothetical protein